MDEEQKRAALAEKIETRKSYDDKWAGRDFTLAQAFLWLAILSSFCTAILAVAGTVPQLLLGFLAAIPGMAILVDKNFSFARRARWHRKMVARLDQLVNQLQFEGAKVEDVAKQLGVLLIEMEEEFPDMKHEGLPDNSPPGK
jgi:Flp pilus assembly protein TadB